MSNICWHWASIAFVWVRDAPVSQALNVHELLTLRSFSKFTIGPNFREASSSANDGGTARDFRERSNSI